MTSDWVTTSTATLIAEGALSIGDGYRAKNSELDTVGLPFARAGNIDGGIHIEDADLLGPEGVRVAGGKISMPGDTVLTSKGTVGRFAYVSESTPRFVYSPQLCFWRVENIEDLHPRFLFYWLQGCEAQQQFNVLKAQTDMADYVSLGDQRAMKITLPPLPEQRRIAGLLAALDEKIEHNEYLSRRLATLAQLRFESANLQWWPRSETASLGDLGAPTRDSAEAGLPYIGLSAMPRGSTVLSEWNMEDSPSGNAVRFFRGDVLFGKLRPYFKKVGVAPIDGRCSTEILVLRPAKPNLWGALLGNMSSDPFIEFCVQVSKGTKMPRAEWKDIAAFPVAMPSDQQASELTAEMKLLHNSGIALVHENKTLISIRDLLLPRMVSGRIRVPRTLDSEDVLGSSVEQARSENQ